MQPSDGYFVSTGDKRVKALCFNAQSLKARDKFYELRLITAAVPELDMILVVETWFSEGCKQFFNLPNYNAFHNIRKENKRNNSSQGEFLFG